MERSDLFSSRAGRRRRLSAGDFAQLVWTVIVWARAKGLFAEAFGVFKNEAGRNEKGIHADDADRYLLDSLHTAETPSFYLIKYDAPPPAIGMGDEDLLFDLLELLYRECVSLPGRRESGGHLGFQFHAPFDREAGQHAFREQLNPILSRHEPPFEMTPSGEVVEVPPEPLRPVLDTELPASTGRIIAEPFDAAIDQFRRRDATEQDKRSAIKHMADILERLKEDVDEGLMPADEDALFHIANKFGLRHFNREQRLAYDKAIWFDWMFYVYVATARALLAVRERELEQQADDDDGLDPETGGLSF